MKDKSLIRVMQQSKQILISFLLYMQKYKVEYVI